MVTLIKTTDPVLLSYAQSLLSEAGIEAAVFDTAISMVEGSIGVFPRRLVVATADLPRARLALWEGGLMDEIAPAGGP